MLWIIIALALTIVIAVSVWFSTGDGAFTVGTGVFAGFVSLIIIGLCGNLITGEEMESAYSTTTQTYTLDELSDGKYAILASGTVTFRTDDYQNEWLTQVYLKEGSPSVVKTTYEPNHFWTLFDKSPTYELTIPSGGLDF